MEVAGHFVLAAAAFNLPWQVVVGIVIFTTALIMVTRRKAARSAGMTTSAARRQRARADTRRSREESLQDIMLQMEALARESVAQMDTRYHRLESVIRDADQRIAELRGLMVERAETDVVCASDVNPASGLDVTIDEDVTPTPFTAGQTGPGKPERSVVYELADTGAKPAQIARRLGCSQGEIDLILGLRAGGAVPSPVWP